MSRPVSIIIPVFNQVEYTRACVDTLLTDPDVATLAQIVIVDSGSTDTAPSYLQSLKQQQQHIVTRTMPTNVGYSLACNAGAEVADGAEFVFINNDTIPERGWLPALRNTLALPRVGLVGPKLLYPGSRTINSAGYVYRKDVGAFYHLYHGYPENFIGVNRRREFQAVLGACVIIRRSLFEAIGGITDFGYDDLDLCFKIREKGWTILFEPRATVLHHGSVTLKNSPPGSIPKTDTTSFGKRWPRETFLEDDDRYYREDGLAYASMKDGVVQLREVISESTAFVTSALAAKANGDLPLAEAELNRAIAVYLGNQVAHEELIILHLECGNLTRAIEGATRMAAHVIDAHQARLTLSNLLLSTPDRLRAKEILDELKLDWLTPATLKAQIEAAEDKLSA